MIEQLILVRHGETVDNARGVAQGWSDSALSPRGEEQVRRLARRLATFRPTALYASDLARAVTTAEMIAAEIGLSLSKLPELREMNCGRWEGLEFSRVRDDDPELHRRWSIDPTVACPEGESYADVLERFRRGLTRIENENGHAGARPLIVSHGTAIRIATTHLLDLPLATARRFAQDNAAINLFERRGNHFVLRIWNDATHCRELEN